MSKDENVGKEIYTLRKERDTFAANVKELTKKPIQFSTLVICMVDVWEDSVTYISKTDPTGREYHHIIPAKSKFPYGKLEVGHWYTLVSVKMDNTWWYYCAWDLSDSQVLIDNTLNDVVNL